MILVDSSVWIDFFNGVATRESALLDGLLGREPLLTGDLILAEVLQGWSASQSQARTRPEPACAGLPVLVGCRIPAAA